LGERGRVRRLDITRLLGFFKSAVFVLQLRVFIRRFFGMESIPGIVQDNKVVLSEEIHIPDGTRVIVTVPSNVKPASFWEAASAGTLDRIWNNEEDDIYADLLKE
jgi:hypothetical protein